MLLRTTNCSREQITNVAIGFSKSLTRFVGLLVAYAKSDEKIREPVDLACQGGLTNSKTNDAKVRAQRIKRSLVARRWASNSHLKDKIITRWLERAWGGGN